MWVGLECSYSGFLTELWYEHLTWHQRCFQVTVSVPTPQVYVQVLRPICTKQKHIRPGPSTLKVWDRKDVWILVHGFPPGRCALPAWFFLCCWRGGATRALPLRAPALLFLQRQTSSLFENYLSDVFTVMQEKCLPTVCWCILFVF